MKSGFISKVFDSVPAQYLGSIFTEDERTWKTEVHSATKLVLICHRRGAATLDNIEGRHDFFIDS